MITKAKSNLYRTRMTAGCQKLVKAVDVLNAKKNIVRSFVACFIVLAFMVFAMRNYFLDSQPYYGSQLRISDTHITEEGESEESIVRRDLLLYYHQNVYKANAPRKKRFPDFIGIGVEKCGSGALRHMLKQHPMIRESTPKETHFFSMKKNYIMGLEYYKSLMPDVADYELVTEKTPAYFNSFWPSLPSVPENIKRNLPGAKVVVVLCDPVNRTFSDFIQEVKMGAISQTNIYEVVIYELISMVEGNLRRLAGNESAITDYINRLKLDRPRSHILTTGLYYYHIKKWLKVFEKDEFLIVDGEKLITDPASVIDKVQEFLHLPKFIVREDFVRNPDSGFFCISPVTVVNANGEHPKVVKEKAKCMLGNVKGRTRNGAWSYTPDKTVLSLVRKFYEEPNKKLFQLLGRKFNWQ